MNEGELVTGKVWLAWHGQQLDIAHPTKHGVARVVKGDASRVRIEEVVDKRRLVVCRARSKNDKCLFAVLPSPNCQDEEHKYNERKCSNTRYNASNNVDACARVAAGIGEPDRCGSIGKISRRRR